MDVIMLSIHPKYARMIFEGKKLVELRKTVPAKRPSLALVYETRNGGGCGKVIGEIQISGFGEIDYEFYSRNPGYYAFIIQGMARLSNLEYEFYARKKNIYYWGISAFYLYDESKDLAEYGMKRPPLSWCFVKRDFLEREEQK